MFIVYLIDISDVRLVIAFHFYTIIYKLNIILCKVELHICLGCEVVC